MQHNDTPSVPHMSSETLPDSLTLIIEEVERLSEDILKSERELFKLEAAGEKETLRYQRITGERNLLKQSKTEVIAELRRIALALREEEASDDNKQSYGMRR